MGKVILIPGMGANSRVYRNIVTGDAERVPVDWLKPDADDNLKSYADKLIRHYNIGPGDIVIGNSLGGMIAVEIAKKLELKAVILISSIKTVDEAPWFFHLFRWLPVYKIIPFSLITHIVKYITPIFGRMTAAEKKMFLNMLNSSSPLFIKWSMAAALHWKNKIIPANLYHIAGDADLIFDYRRIKNAAIVKGGTHIMIFDRADEINQWLKPILEK